MIRARDRTLRAAAGLVALAWSVAIPGGIARAQEPAAKAPAGHVAAAPAYTIGPADTLRVIVWKEPELTLDVTVRIDGMITLPLLGDVEAARRTPNQLAASLAQALERFIETPRVSVAVTQANSAKFYVVGQVTKPGEFTLSSRTTVLQALALAGGFKEFAKTDSIVIVRDDQSVVPVNYKRIAEGKDVSQNVSIARGDTIVVP
jgi:polysaccharide export outer membrane protein